MARALLALLLAAALCSAQAREPQEAREPQQTRQRQQLPQPQQRESVRAQELLRVIDGCVARLDSALDVGYPAIAARCPELSPALSRSPWAAWLPADWNRPDNQLSMAGLTELHTLLARQPDLETARRGAPRTSKVGAILAAVTREQSGGVSGWQRLKDWLRRLLGSRPRANDDWLRHFVAELNLSTQATQLIAWGAFALVVALAGAIVISELRVAGILGGRARRARVGARPAGARGTASLAAIERAPLEQQPALLLELIASRLVEQQRLPPARALTVRELGRRARLEESARTRLAQLAAVSEQVRFADAAVAVASLDSALRSGRFLLTMLEVSPAAVAEAG